MQGVRGFDKRARQGVPADIKHKAVQEVLGKGLSFEAVALKYQVSISAVYSWIQRVKDHGFASLLNIKQGRLTIPLGILKKKQPETELEKLQEELPFLIEENALQKK